MSQLSADETPIQRPSPGELWWVAVEGAPHPSGGWLVLADQGERGAGQIQETFEKAGIPILAAVDAAALVDFALLADKAPRLRTVIWQSGPQGAEGRFEEREAAEALVDLRLDAPEATILLSEPLDAVYQLADRMQHALASPSLEGVRMDLRAAPRGQGAWGLAQLRAL